MIAAFTVSFGEFVKEASHSSHERHDIWSDRLGWEGACYIMKREVKDEIQNDRHYELTQTHSFKPKGRSIQIIT
jgi:hypothetical protein